MFFSNYFCFAGLTAALNCTFCHQKAEVNENLRRQARVGEEEIFLGYPKWRRCLYFGINSRQFELFISFMTFLILISMALEHYDMPIELEFGIQIANYVFTAILTIELALKLVSFGIANFFLCKWNTLDFTVLILTYGGIIIEQYSGIDPSFLKLVRIVRFFRVLKLLKAARGIRKLLKTIVDALPQVGNLFMLFLLLFFIYAAIGVELYGKIDCDRLDCEHFGRHVNFQNFGMSLLTCFRIFTGDNWNELLREALSLTDKANCMNTFNSTRDDVLFECASIRFISPLFFVSFVLFSQVIMINVVIAVLMGSLEGTSFFRDLEIEEMGREMAQKVGMLENVVTMVAPQLVSRLTDKMHTTEKEVVAIVSSEYALRTMASSYAIESDASSHPPSRDTLSVHPVKKGRSCYSIFDGKQTTTKLLVDAPNDNQLLQSESMNVLNSGSMPTIALRPSVCSRKSSKHSSVGSNKQSTSKSGKKRDLPPLNLELDMQMLENVFLQLTVEAENSARILETRGAVDWFVDRWQPPTATTASALSSPSCQNRSSVSRSPSRRHSSSRKPSTSPVQNE